jgi:hypothetical protein
MDMVQSEHERPHFISLEKESMNTRSEIDQTTPATIEKPELITRQSENPGPDHHGYNAYDLELISTWSWEGNPNTEEA